MGTDHTLPYIPSICDRSITHGDRSHFTLHPLNLGQKHHTWGQITLYLTSPQSVTEASHMGTDHTLPYIPSICDRSITHGDRSHFTLHPLNLGQKHHTWGQITLYLTSPQSVTEASHMGTDHTLPYIPSICDRSITHGDRSYFTLHHLNL